MLDQAMFLLSHSNISKTLALLIAIINLGCDKEAVKQCETLDRAIRTVHRYHLVAAGKPQKILFARAQKKFLEYTGAPVPKASQDSIGHQCVASLEAAKRVQKKTPYTTLTLNLLHFYVREMDPHSTALSFDALASQNLFLEGFGFTFEKTATTLRVLDVIAGSPANRARLRENMHIVRVNNHNVARLSTKILTELIQHPDTTTLSLVVTNGTEERKVMLRRETFRASYIKLGSFPTPKGPIGYIKLRHLTGDTSFFAEALNAMSTSRALVLDLRGNVGGDLSAAADLANFLISNSKTFLGIMGRNLTLDDKVELRQLSSVWDGPLVVLVNSHTKSAAEALAGSLQDYGAVVVGERTFGKGTRTRFLSLENIGIRGGVDITDAFIVRPSGQMIQRAGITPDLVVDSQKPQLREADYPNIVKAPVNISPLDDYDASILPTASEIFKEKLAELSTVEFTTEDKVLELGLRVGTLLADFSAADQLSAE